jgi:hypothetical protein
MAALPSIGSNAPAMSWSSRTFLATSSTPGSVLAASAGLSRSRARFVENPTWITTTEPSSAAASALRSTFTASGASLPSTRSCG